MGEPGQNRVDHDIRIDVVNLGSGRAQESTARYAILRIGPLAIGIGMREVLWQCMDEPNSGVRDMGKIGRPPARASGRVGSVDADGNVAQAGP